MACDFAGTCDPTPASQQEPANSQEPVPMVICNPIACSQGKAVRESSPCAGASKRLAHGTSTEVLLDCSSRSPPAASPLPAKPTMFASKLRERRVGRHHREQYRAPGPDANALQTPRGACLRIRWRPQTAISVVPRGIWAPTRGGRAPSPRKRLRAPAAGGRGSATGPATLFQTQTPCQDHRGNTSGRPRPPAGDARNASNCTPARTYTHAHARAHIHARAHAWTHSHAHTRTHTHTHTHQHTQSHTVQHGTVLNISQGSKVLDQHGAAI